jgi:hypothetical protein
MATDPRAYSSHGLLITGGGGGVVESVAIGQIDPPYCKTVGGETRTIRLNNAGAVQGAGAVTIGGTNCSIVSWSDTLIVITTPAKTAGAYDLVVTENGGTDDTLANGVTYYAAAADPTFVVEADASPEDDAYD